MVKFSRCFSFLLLTSLMFSCTKESDYTSEFLLKEGFEMTAVVTEPMLKGPVAMDFDLKGRIWTVELTGYMRDIDGSDEDYPDGKISFFKDHNHDGIADEKVIFLDSLVLPRAVKYYNGGILYAEPPNLWWVELKEDDSPGKRVLVDSMYTNGGNVEHMPNGLLYNIDNWIYNAKSDRRYRLKNGIWEVEPTIYRGQWGITNDETGRLFYNDNSNPLFGDHVLPNSFDQNQYLKKKAVYKDNIAETRKFYPHQATAVNRGYQKGVLMPDGKVSNFTSACSPLIYKGNALGKEYLGDAFVCGPEANLIKRYKMDLNDGMVTASMTDTISEFIVSTDETFRPVNIFDGPDGNMYIVDMRKGIIQHRAYLTTYLIDLIQKRKLDQYEDGGRIYRLSKANYSYDHKSYDEFSENEWLSLLSSENYWERIKAQEYLVQNGTSESIAELRSILEKNDDNYSTIHCLWTLEGMDALKPNDIIKTIANTNNADVMNTALSLLQYYIEEVADEDITKIFEKAKDMSDESINLHLAYLSGQSARKPFRNLWSSLSIAENKDEIYYESLASGIKDINAFETYHSLNDNSALFSLLEQTMDNQKEGKIQNPELNFNDVTDPRTRGLFLYHQYCATCHGRDGKGIESIAPPLYESPYLNGPSEHLVVIALQGMEGPLTMDGVDYNFAAAMPGIKNNPDLSDQDVRDILLWIRNSFSSSHESFSTDLVKSIRADLDGRQDLLTQEEIDEWPTK